MDLNGIEDDSSRVLGDDEIIRVLSTRDDIPYLEKQIRLRNVEAIALSIGAILGLWINSIPPVPVGHGFHQKGPGLSAANLPVGPRITHEYKGMISFERSIGTPPADLPPPVRRSPAPPESTRESAPQVQPGVLSTPTRGTAAADHLASALRDDSILLVQATAYKKHGDHGPAFEAFGKVLTHDPHNTTALTGMGDLFLATGLLDAAVSYYRAAIAVNPRLAAAHDGLGSARYFISTMAANPNYVAQMKIRDAKRYIRSQYDSAMAEYTAAISIDSTCVDALTNRGVLRDIRNDYEGAVADYTLAVKINPSYAEAYSKRASAYRSLGRLNEALADYTTAISLDSSSYPFDATLHFTNAYFGRGVLYYTMGDLDRAIADYDSALALSPNHSMAILNRAIARSDKKEYQGALAGYTRAIALLSPLEYNGARDLACLRRGNTYKALGEYAKAIDDYKSVLKSPLMAAKSCWRIAECYCLLKNDETALEWLRKAVANGFTDFKAWKRDEDLAALRKTKAFQDLIGQ